MSWNAHFPSRAALDTKQPDFATPADVLADGAGGQVVIALEAAHRIISSGAVGDSSRDFTVSIAGHSNADHAPKDGWANDTLTITVTQK